MKIQTATLACNKDIGPHLVIEEKGLFWLLMEYLGDAVFPVVTFHLLCCKTPEWTWKIGWGEPDEEMGEGIRVHNLGHYLWVAGQWLSLGFRAYRHHRTVGRVPVTAGQVHELFPGADPIFSGDDPDAMNQRPADEGEVTL